MNKVGLVTTICMLFILSACEDDTLFKQQIADPILIEARTKILSDKDSAEFYANRILNAYKTTQDKEKLILDNAPYIKYFENHINALLDQVNLMSAERKMVPGVYDTWLSDLNLKTLSEKNKKLYAAGINISVMPAIRPEGTIEDKKAAIQPITEVQPGSDSMYTFTDKQNTFSIDLPDNWEAHETFNNGNEVVIAAPDKGDNAKRSCALSINIIAYSKEMSNENFYTSNMSLMKRDVENFEMLKEGPMNLNGIKAKYAAFYIGNNKVKMGSLMVFFFKDKKGYIISGSAAGELFEAYKPIYFKSISSFMLLSQ
jgi:hypothetical protein